MLLQEHTKIKQKREYRHAHRFLGSLGRTLNRAAQAHSRQAGHASVTTSAPLRLLSRYIQGKNEERYSLSEMIAREKHADVHVNWLRLRLWLVVAPLLAVCLLRLLRVVAALERARACPRVQIS